MGQSGAGDWFDMVVGRQSGSITNIGASGWFDIKKTDGQTGLISDFSGPNAITLDGLEAMMKGFSAGNDATLVATTMALMNFSDQTGAVALGESSGLGGTIQDGEANLAASDGTVIVDPDSPVGTSVNAFFAYSDSGTARTIFHGRTPDASGSGTLVLASQPIKVVASNTCTINCIQIVDDVAPAGDGTGDRVLAARAVNSPANSGTAAMTAISLSNTDTLSVTYTLTLTAT